MDLGFFFAAVWEIVKWPTLLLAAAGGVALLVCIAAIAVMIIREFRK